EEIDGKVGDEVGDVAGMFLAFTHLDQDGIVIEPLAGKDVPVVEAGGVAAEVPFADHAGVIAGGLEVLGERRLAAVEAVEDGDAVHVGIFAGEDGRPAGGADGIGDQATVEAHPLPGDAVDLRCLVDFAAVGADGVGGVIVGHDVQDVRSLPLIGGGGRGRTRWGGPPGGAAPAHPGPARGGPG